MSTKNNKNNESREKTFDEYYKENILSSSEHIEGIEIAKEKLKKKYEEYEETESFIDYICSIERVFAQAETNKWSVEETQDEIIKGKIYIMAQSTGISESVFQGIYEEFVAVRSDVDKIQEIAQKLIDKYSNIEDCLECEDCQKFIMYVREFLILFTKTMKGDKNFDEIPEVKSEIVRIEMNIVTMDGRPKMETLESIYDDFISALKE